MGQRLVVTIHAFNEDIAKIYYHWSAYSLSALQEANDIINGVDWENAKDVRDLQYKLIRFVEEAGGCIDGNEREYQAIQEMFPGKEFKKEGSRNDGLIALTEQGMDDLEYWSEGDLTIDFDDEQVWNCVIDCYQSLEEVNDSYFYDGDEDRFSDNDFIEVNADFENIQFKDLDRVIDIMDKLWHNQQFEFKCNGMYCMMIA